MRLFLPSEFGFPSRLFGPDSPLHGKRAFAESLQELGLPSLRVSTGFFPDTTFLPDFFGLHFPGGKARILGSPDVPVSRHCSTRPSRSSTVSKADLRWVAFLQLSFTTVNDIGSFLGQLLTTRPVDELLSLGEIAIEGSRATLGQTVAYYEQSRPGKHVDVTVVPIEQAEDELETKEGYAYVLDWLLLAVARGVGDLTAGGTVETANKLVPGWKPSSVRDYLATL